MRNKQLAFEVAVLVVQVAYTDVPPDQGAALHITAFEAMHTLIANSAQQVRTSLLVTELCCWRCDAAGAHPSW